MNFDIDFMMNAKIQKKISPKIKKNASFNVKRGIVLGFLSAGVVCFLLALLSR